MVALTVSMFASAAQMPSGIPIATPSTPVSAASPRSNESTWRRVAPSERKMPSSFRRRNSRALRRAVDEERADEEAHQAERREIQAKRLEQLLRLLFALTGCQHAHRAGELRLDVACNRHAVGAVLELEVDQMHLAVHCEQALHLRDVHDDEPRAGKRRALAEVDGRANDQRNAARTDRDPHRVAQLPATRLTDLRCHRHPARRRQRLG